MKHIVSFPIFENEKDFGLSPVQIEIFKKGLATENWKFWVSQDEKTGKLIIDKSFDLSWMETKEVPNLNIDEVDSSFIPPPDITSAKNFPRICRHLTVGPSFNNEIPDYTMNIRSLKGISERVSSLTIESTLIQNLDYMPFFEEVIRYSRPIKTSLSLFSNRRLESLKGCPEVLSGNFYCVGNAITSLEGGPREVGGNYTFFQGIHPIKDWKGIARKIGGSVDFYGVDILPGEKWGPKMWVRLWKGEKNLRKYLISMLEKDWIEDLEEEKDPWLIQFLALVWEEPDFRVLRDSLKFKNPSSLSKIEKTNDTNQLLGDFGI